MYVAYAVDAAEEYLRVHYLMNNVVEHYVLHMHADLYCLQVQVWLSPTLLWHYIANKILYVRRESTLGFMWGGPWKLAATPWDTTREFCPLVRVATNHIHISVIHVDVENLNRNSV